MDLQPAAGKLQVGRQCRVINLYSHPPTGIHNAPLPQSTMHDYRGPAAAARACAVGVCTGTLHSTTRLNLKSTVQWAKNCRFAGPNPRPLNANPTTLPLSYNGVANFSLHSTHRICLPGKMALGEPRRPRATGSKDVSISALLVVARDA